MADVIPLGGVTRLKLPADRILEESKGELKTVVLCGWDKNGELYFATSDPDGGTVLWLLEQCKLALLNVGRGD